MKNTRSLAMICLEMMAFHQVVVVPLEELLYIVVYTIHPGYPFILNQNGIEITALRFLTLPQVTIVATYRSPRLPTSHLWTALRNLLISLPTASNVFIGDFNMNWLSEREKVPLLNSFPQQFHYRQLISTYTTDYKTCLDHIYTNLPQANAYGNLLETYFSDHKAVYVLINLF